MKKHQAEPNPMQRELDEHLSTVRNFQEHLTTLANQLIAVGANVQAGRLLVLDRVVYFQNTDFMLSMSAAVTPTLADVDADADADEQEQQRAPRKPRAAKLAGAEHRHKFNAEGLCTVQLPPSNAICGKLKAAGGRPRKPDAAERTVPLPVVDAPPVRIAMTPQQLAAAADKYQQGGQGSTGTGDGR